MRYFRVWLPVLNLIMPCKVIIPVSYEKEYEKFIFKLDKQTLAKLTREIDLLELRGPVLPEPYVKKIQKQIWELRIRGKIEVRILYTVKNSNVYLLSWFIKKSHKTTLSDLRKAISRL